jgi:hypothetical protein
MSVSTMHKVIRMQPRVSITRHDFLEDRQGRTFADVLNDPEQPFNAVLDFFNDEDRQRRMVGSEIHHERARLVEVVWELEAQPVIESFLSPRHSLRAHRLREAVGVVVGMVVERLRWEQTGKRGLQAIEPRCSQGRRHLSAPRTGSDNEINGSVATFQFGAIT